MTNYESEPELAKIKFEAPTIEMPSIVQPIPKYYGRVSLFLRKKMEKPAVTTMT